MNDASDVIGRIRCAPGRAGPLAAAPNTPAIEEPVVRLVHTEFGLPELFSRKAEENQIEVEGLFVEDLAARLIAFLRENRCRRLGLAVSSLLDKLGMERALREAGFDLHRGDAMSPDQAFELDCGITDAWAAVAETGSLVIRPTPDHGRLLSLAPPIHVAILEPRNFVPDLLDLFEKLRRDGAGEGVAIISGPSKTADIEMNLVVGVHGPKLVRVFLLQ